MMVQLSLLLMTSLNEVNQEKGVAQKSMPETRLQLSLNAFQDVHLIITLQTVTVIGFKSLSQSCFIYNAHLKTTRINTSFK